MTTVNVIASSHSFITGTLFLFLYISITFTVFTPFYSCSVTLVKKSSISSKRCVVYLYIAYTATLFRPFNFQRPFIRSLGAVDTVKRDNVT